METPLIIAIVALVVLGGIGMLTVLRRRDNSELSHETMRRDKPVDLAEAEGRKVETAAVVARREANAPAVVSHTPAVFVPPDPEALGVTRRQFLNRSIVGMMTLSLSSFGASLIAFLWPSGVSGFGSAITVGNVGTILEEINANNGFLYSAEGRMWLTEYPSGAVDAARSLYSGPELAGMEAGVIALYQKCPHLGCRVPSCNSSQWFECPCHGSQYNQVGEKKGGPAPRGMDRFAMSVDAANVLTVDTGTIIQGPPIGTNTTGQEAEGPNCIGQSDH